MIITETNISRVSAYNPNSTLLSEFEVNLTIKGSNANDARFLMKMIGQEFEIIEVSPNKNALFIFTKEESQ